MYQTYFRHISENKILILREITYFERNMKVIIFV